MGFSEVSRIILICVYFYFLVETCKINYSRFAHLSLAATQTQIKKKGEKKQENDYDVSGVAGDIEHLSKKRLVSSRFLAVKKETRKNQIGKRKRKCDECIPWTQLVLDTLHAL